MYDDNFRSPGSSDLSQDSYFAYMDEISQYKLLSIDEEISLFQRIQNGDDVARDLFIKSNLRLVVKQARKFYSPGSNQLLDLIQDGNIGLLKAVEQFDPTRGCKFSTYAVYHINKAIQCSSCRTGLPIVIPQKKMSLINRMKFSIDRFEIENGTKPTCAELSARLDVPEDVIKELMPFVYAPVSLHSQINEGEDDRELLDVFSEHYDDGDREAESALMINETREEFRNIVFEALSDREAYILSSRNGLFGFLIKDVAQLSLELHISKQAVRQAEARSIAKLKKYLLSMEKSLADFI